MNAGDAGELWATFIEQVRLRDGMEKTPLNFLGSVAKHRECFNQAVEKLNKERDHMSKAGDVAKSTVETAETMLGEVVDGIKGAFSDARVLVAGRPAPVEGAPVDEHCHCSCIPRETIQAVLDELQHLPEGTLKSLHEGVDFFNVTLDAKIRAGARCACVVPPQKQG